MIGGPMSLLAAGPALPATPPPRFDETATTFSQSGQFVVSGPRPKGSAPLDTRSPGRVQRDLTPQTLAVSCERVKAEILRALNLPDTWRNAGGRSGKILVAIDERVRTNMPIAVAASPFEHGWQFRIPLPTRIAEERLVRALTEAVLMELANRHGNQRLGEPPLWLVEGVTQTILAASPNGVILQPQTRGTTDIKMDEALAGVRRELTRRPPLEFHELSQPDISRLDETQWHRFSTCSHLCFHELTRLPDGKARIARWLGSLQRYWNWQTGFTEAFQPMFRSLLDVEKWWALTLANFTGRNQATAWPAGVALRRLDEALQPVGILPNAGGRASRLAISDVIASWDYPRQLPVLRQLLPQLHAIRVSSPLEVAPLVNRYIDVLEEYLAARNRSTIAPLARGQAPPSSRLITRETVGRLRELDGQRTQLAKDLASPKQPATGT